MSKLIQRAYRIAETMHDGQSYGDQPFMYHLAQAVGVLVEYGVTDSELLAAGWLHDIIEDGDMDHGAVISVFNRRIGDIVFACSGFGENRKARNQDIYDKVSKSVDAAIVKAADRIANMRNCNHTRDNRRKMYRREADMFATALLASFELGTHTPKQAHTLNAMITEIRGL